MSEARSSRRARLADVAAWAGVSLTTASRALSGVGRTSARTRARVEQAATELGYVPNALARSLRARHTRAFGLLLADLGDPVHAQLAAGFEMAAAEVGYGVIIVAASNLIEEERRALTVFMERTMDGVCLASAVLDPQEARARAGSIPVVVVQPDHTCRLRDPDALPPGTIQTDDAAGVGQAVRHLVDMGRRELCYLGAGVRPTNRLRQATAERLGGEMTGRPLRTIDLPDDAWTDPVRVAAALGSGPPEAVICYDDKLALALLDGLRRRGVSVPDEVAVVGFDDIPFARLANPRLTTVCTSVAEMGRIAARALVEATATGSLPASRVLPVELVIRESSAARRPRGRWAASHAPVAEGAGA